MPELAHGVYSDNPEEGPFVIFPTHAHQILSNVIHILGQYSSFYLIVYCCERGGCISYCPIYCYSVFHKSVTKLLQQDVQYWLAALLAGQKTISSFRVAGGQTLHGLGYLSY